MSSISYGNIEDRLVALLQADPWFGQSANCKFIDYEAPESGAAVVEFTDLFPQGKIPGLVVMILASDTKREVGFGGACTYTIPAKFVGVVQGVTKKIARRAALTLADNTERFLALRNTTTNDLGITNSLGAMITGINSVVDVKKSTSGIVYYGLVDTGCTITVQSMG